MHIEYRITEKDYKAASTLVMRKRSNMSALDYYGPHIFGIIWIAAAVFTSFAHPDDDLDLLLTLGVLPILMGFIVLRRRRIRTEYKKLKQFHLLQTLDLDSNGLRLITTDGTTRTAWSVYSRFIQDNDMFVLFMDKSLEFVPIPKSYLTIGQIDELQALLTARLSPK
jgi:hypothetical protein